MIALLSAVPGFPGSQTSLNPAGPQALHIEHTFSPHLLDHVDRHCSSFSRVLVFGVMRQHAQERCPLPSRSHPASGAPGTLGRWQRHGLTVILLFVMMISSFHHQPPTRRCSPNSPALTINVYGHQWWWEVQYPNDEQPYRIVRTANEIHVPVGTNRRYPRHLARCDSQLLGAEHPGQARSDAGLRNDLTLQVDQPGRGADNARSSAACSTRTCPSTWWPSPAKTLTTGISHSSQPAAEPHDTADRARTAGLSHSRLRDVPYHSRHFGRLEGRT